jgi:hypothetical protein
MMIVRSSLEAQSMEEQGKNWGCSLSAPVGSLLPVGLESAVVPPGAQSCPIGSAASAWDGKVVVLIVLSIVLLRSNCPVNGCVLRASDFQCASRQQLFTIDLRI